MLKNVFFAGAVLIAASASPALAQSRLDGVYAARHSYSYLLGRCDQALAARGSANASTAVRQRCVANLRTRLAQKSGRQRQANCYHTIDPNTRGWSSSAHGFNLRTYRAQTTGSRPCPYI